MEFKKTCIIICCFISLVGCSHKKQYGDIYNENFKNALSSGVIEIEGGSFFEIKGQFETTSELASIMAYYYRTEVAEGKDLGDYNYNCEETVNNFYCDIAMTYLENDFKIEVSEIDNINSFLDLYFVYELSLKINDLEVLSLLEEQFSNINIKSDTNILETRYYDILNYYLNNVKLNYTISDLNEEMSLVTQIDLIDYDQPFYIYSNLVIGNILEGDINTRNLENLYESTSVINSLILNEELVFFINIKILEKLHQKESYVSQKLIDKLQEEPEIFEVYSYNLEGLRNLYMLANILSKKNYEYHELAHDTLLRYYSSLNITDKDISWQNQYYISILNYFFETEYYIIEHSETNCEKEVQLIEKYYCALINEQEISFEKESFENNDLYLKILELSTKKSLSADDKKELENLFEEVLMYDSSLDYITQNIYIQMLINHNITFDGNKVEKLIGSFECSFGYCGKEGNYDVERGIYYNNILILLDYEEGVEYAQKFK